MSITPLSLVRPLSRPRSRAEGRAGARRVHRTTILQRERHEPEYGVLVAIVALAAIGILMVYSSSAMKAFLQQDDTFAIVGPQIQWAALGLVAMVVMMRVDYRWLRVVSVPMFADRDRCPDPGVRARAQRRRRQLGALASLRPLPAVHPAEYMKLALVVYLVPLVREARLGRPRASGRARCRSL